MKYLILVLTILASNFAAAKTQQQTLGAEELKRLAPLEVSHVETFKALKAKKITAKAGVLKLKSILTDLQKHQTRFQQKTQLTGVMQRQFAYYFETMIQTIKAETEFFEGKINEAKLKTVAQGYFNAATDYNTLLNETPNQTSKRLGATTASLERQTEQVFVYAKEGKIPQAKAVELLQRAIPAAFKEIEAEEYAISAVYKNDPSVAAMTTKMVSVARLNAQASWKLGNALIANDANLVAEAVDLIKQKTAIIDSIRGGPAPARQTASSKK